MISQSSRALNGQCMCGAVRYEVLDEFAYALNCHCSNCRRATGAAFKPFAGIRHEQFRITQGEADLKMIGEATGCDMRCQRCGSYLYSIVRGGEYIHVALGTLTDNPSIRPTAHIFVGSKAEWFTITDELPQYQEHVAAKNNQG